MNEEEKEILEQLREKRNILQEQAPKNIVIQNIKLLGKIDLKRKETDDKRENKEIKKANLYLVEEYDIEKDKIILKYYADDEFIGIDNNEEFLQTGFARENYETTDTIKDVLENLKEKEETQKNSEEKTRQVYSLDELEELEAEQEKEEKKGKNEDKEDKTKNDLTGKKPKGVVQTIDPHKTYVNSIETVSKAYGIPDDVDELAIADKQAGDKDALSDDKTIYMLGKNGRTMGNAGGKDIKDLFEYDASTGKNPMYDDNTKIELDGYAEKNKGQTMARFKSKENPDLYLSAEQKKWGQYNQVYAEQKTRNGNDAVGIELETPNSGIQTDLEEQKVNDYGSGNYKKEYIDNETDMHKAHGDDEMKIAIENADGLDYTKEVCESPYVPDTEITWEQLSKLLGDKNVEELQKEFLKQYDGNNSEKLILEMQEEYKEEEKKVEESVEEKKIEDEYEGRVPWDVTKH